jgi:hypothetical protein
MATRKLFNIQKIQMKAIMVYWALVEKVRSVADGSSAQLLYMLACYPEIDTCSV